LLPTLRYRRFRRFQRVFAHEDIVVCLQLAIVMLLFTLMMASVTLMPRKLVFVLLFAFIFDFIVVYALRYLLTEKTSYTHYFRCAFR